ncbi:zinc-dependent metalloprotease [Tenggerimyces flavus]|uniref:Zinc-dependent metalloprotease n=1 Tax=Tenggerimyces flavus TaxID=1708749 RepID=A0ABV7YDC6_9ACTN|nr:zinc-dependent metalloprotease [Tenggerimyces flavus]MBM7791396.1 coenzyme F420 biosynthesis associated uncharacterized protein [Tenggerimyces flavus]
MSTDDTTATADATESMVDWDFAVSTARRLTRPGPDISREEAAQAVSDLREFAALSEGHVREYTGLHTSGGRAPVLVVDRNGWVQANADGFREVLAPLAAKLREKRGSDQGGGGPSLGSFGARVTGFEAGALLAFLSGKVLGQFDPFWNGGTPSANGNGHGAPPVGRLLLVAPNVVHVERELGVDPRDFRLWVCLHEETHRVQFTAVPWLRDYLRGQIGEFLQQTDLDPSAMFSQLRQGLEQVGKAVRGEGQEVSFIDLVQTPAQKAILDRVTAVMSLLEGHADVVMDGVGPGVIPSVDHIRGKFQERRGGGTWLDQLLKRLLGLDAKMKQYRDGAIFVRGVVDKVGMEGFNRVWTSGETLPTKAEITDPDAWVRRVHGDAAVA